MFEKKDIKEYYEIFTECWKLFRKYYEDDADLSRLEPDIAAHGNKYKHDDRLYHFACELFRPCLHELVEIKELRKNGGTNRS